jgi:hypothetical protein
MTSRAELLAFMAKEDAHVLDEAARIIRRLRVQPEGTSRAAFCRTLEVTARLRRLDAQRHEQAGRGGGIG